MNRQITCSIIVIHIECMSGAGTNCFLTSYSTVQEQYVGIITEFNLIIRRGAIVHFIFVDSRVDHS